MPYAAAVGAVLGSWLLIGVPLAVAAALAAVCLWRPSPLLVLVAVTAFAGFFGSRALDGLADPPEGPLEGWVTLLDDPRPLGTHGIRVTVRHGDARLEARAYGAVAARLDDALSGERVHISGTARPATSDWHRWRHVAAVVNVDAVGERTGAAPLTAFTNRVRRLLDSGARSLPDDSRAMFTGMVYGDDRSQSPRLYDDFRAAGLGHLLVVSGQNVAFVLALASPLAVRARPGVRLIVLLALLAVFAVLTRFEPSVLRAVTMAGVAVTSAALGRPETGRRTLAWAVAAVLVADPFLVRVLAFQLSVCATCGLLWITPALTEMLPGPRPLRLAAATTAGAQLAVMPLLVAVFGTVPLASLPANVAAGPASAPVMMWGLTGGLGAGLFGGPVAWLIHRPTAPRCCGGCEASPRPAAAAPPAVLGAGGAMLVGTGVALMLGSRWLDGAGESAAMGWKAAFVALARRRLGRSSGIGSVGRGSGGRRRHGQRAGGGVAGARLVGGWRCQAVPSRVDGGGRPRRARETSGPAGVAAARGCASGGSGGCVPWGRLGRSRGAGVARPLPEGGRGGSAHAPRAGRPHRPDRRRDAGRRPGGRGRRRRPRPLCCGLPGRILLEAERIGGTTRPIRARPWPERPVSAANKSGNGTAATRQVLTHLRALSAWAPVATARRTVRS